jgi:uncharacterized membrane protein
MPLSFEEREAEEALEQEHWMNSKWRPMMGWMYMVVCTMDFVIFPILWSLIQALAHGNVSNQWQPITLQGAGLFHISMGAIIGISAYGRTQEKINNVTTVSTAVKPVMPVSVTPITATPIPTSTFEEK